MFQRILVPLDDSTRVSGALRIAASIATWTGAQLVLTHSEQGSASAQNVISARTAMQRHVNALRQQGIQAEYAVETGTREEGIMAAARDRQADLILLVPARREQLEILWYPRSTTHLLNALPAPLLIWPEHQVSDDLLAPPEATVMVPLDGDPDAERSLPFAVALAERYHRSLVLMRAVPATADTGCRDSVRGDGCFSDQVERATAYLHALREHLERTTTETIQCVVVAHEPATQMLRAADTYHAGIIVLCSHSHQTKERYFMGCVATQLLREASVPILVVPPRIEMLRPATAGTATTSHGKMAAGVHS